MFVRLVGAGLMLERFRPADVAVLAAHADDEAARVFNPGPADGDWAAWIERRNDWEAGDHASWAIRSVRGKLLGGISLHRFDAADATSDVGYAVLPPHRGRGIATAALQLVCEYGFTAVGLQRIALYHAVGNLGSCVVADRAGFTLEGTTRSSHVYGDGRRHDEHVHGRLRTDPLPT